MAVKAKINTARDLFYFSDDIMRITGFSQSKSYKIIKQINKELEAQEGQPDCRWRRNRLAYRARPCAFPAAYRRGRLAVPEAGRQGPDGLLQVRGHHRYAPASVARTREIYECKGI